MDTAAVMKNLDLVITSDTATAHLAGALGVPVWVALCVSPDWRGSSIGRLALVSHDATVPPADGRRLEYVICRNGPPTDGAARGTADTA